LDELVEGFVNRLQTKSHVFELFHHSTFSLAIGNELDKYHLSLQDGEVIMNEPVQADIEVNGRTPIIASLLEGKLKLRDGISYHGIQVTGSFRDQLLVESLFFLTGKKAK